MDNLKHETNELFYPIDLFNLNAKILNHQFLKQHTMRSHFYFDISTSSGGRWVDEPFQKAVFFSATV